MRAQIIESYTIAGIRFTHGRPQRIVPTDTSLNVGNPQKESSSDTFHLLLPNLI